MPTTLSPCTTTQCVLYSSSTYPFVHRIIPLTPISFVRFPDSNFSPLGGSFSTGVFLRTNLANCTMSSARQNTNGDSGEGVDDGKDEAESILRTGSLSVRAEMKYSDWESKINRSSKWVVFSIFSAIVLAKHDGEALWAAIGAVVNSMVSKILKRILNHERPMSALRSDPGMPSSHSQSLLYTAVYCIVLVAQLCGKNAIGILLATMVLLIGSYLSWLRVSQGLHTLNQVLVGAVVGSAYGAVWFWSWHAFVLGAFTRYLWVRIPVIIGSVLFSAGFLVYVFQHWVAKERSV